MRPGKSPVPEEQPHPPPPPPQMGRNGSDKFRRAAAVFDTMFCERVRFGMASWCWVLGAYPCMVYYLLSRIGINDEGDGE